MIEDQHFEQAGKAPAFMIGCGLRSDLNLWVKTHRKSGGLDLWTSRSGHSLVVLMMNEKQQVYCILQYTR